MDKLQNLVKAAAEIYLSLADDADSKFKDAAFQVWHELEAKLTKKSKRRLHNERD